MNRFSRLALVLTLFFLASLPAAAQVSARDQESVQLRRHPFGAAQELVYSGRQTQVPTDAAQGDCAYCCTLRSSIEGGQRHIGRSTVGHDGRDRARRVRQRRCAGGPRSPSQGVCLSSPKLPPWRSRQQT